MDDQAAPEGPFFLTPPGEPDILLYVTIAILIVAVLVVGNLYLRLHALPERLAHRGEKIQFEVVAVLGLLALFTHNNLFWVAALLLALVRIPDFSGPLSSIASSMERIAAATSPPGPPTTAHPAQAAEPDPDPDRARAVSSPGPARSAIATPPPSAGAAREI